MIELRQYAYKKVQTANNTTLAFPYATIAGNFLYVAMASFEAAGASQTTPTDTISSSYNTVVSIQSPSANTKLGSWYAENISGGANTVTFDIVGTNNGDISVMVAEFSGVDNQVSALDQATSAGPTTSLTPNSGSITPTARNELLIGAVSWSGSDTTIFQDQVWTSICDIESGTSGMPLGVQYRVQQPIVSEAAQWEIGASRAWCCNVGSFFAAAESTGRRNLYLRQGFS